MVLLALLCLTWTPPAAKGQSAVDVRSPVRGLTTPRQLLELFGIDQSHLRLLIDGLPLHPEDVDVISKILMRFGDLGGHNIQRWLVSETPWEQLVDSVDEQRIQFFDIGGRAIRLERQNIVPEAAALYGFDHFYWVWIQSPEGPLVRVATRTIPRTWSQNGALDEKVRIHGMYLKYSDPHEDSPREHVFAADRIQWFPGRAQPGEGVPQGQVVLGELGMDVSLFDDVRGHNRQPVGAAERDCFYRLMQILHTGPRPGAQHRPVNPPLTDLLRAPQDHHGEYLRLVGTVRRVTDIQVADEELQLQYGIDHYYQLDMFIPLGNRTIQIKRNRDDQEGLVFRNQFPISVCVAEIPAELAQAQAQLDAGEYHAKTLSESFEVHGFFFKVWSYRSTYSTQQDNGRQQISPMLLAYVPRRPDLPGSSGVLETVLAVGFTLSLLLAWLLIWRGEKRSKQSSLARRQREEITTADRFAELAAEAREEAGTEREHESPPADSAQST